MKNQLYITIDTEADADIKWQKPEPLQFTSVTDGIRRYLRPVWDKKEKGKRFSDDVPFHGSDGQ